ncbi:hypothetical protein [Shewanella morhuae]|uniref:hypothetical protein n=1 Tax=Shewanella morhuae TaxID=365591 RepID=UPI001BBB0ADC|nr:hypothetical protein [Shewanella morhuae]GIU14390.1 hypothetical protein TUM4641_34660 [Shewanella morhuae]
MNQSEDFGKILKPWPNLVDHFNDSWSDFAAICAVNSSNKEVGKSIGNKGVGFRSIWEFCHQVQIVSCLSDKDEFWGFQLNFPFNQDCLDLWNDTPQAEDISKCINALPQEKGIAPSFYFPKYLSGILLDEVGFTTKITLQNLSESKFSQLEELLGKLAHSPLMFSGFTSNIERQGNLIAEFDIGGQYQTVNLKVDESRYRLVEVDTSELIHPGNRHVLESIDYNLTRKPQLYLAIPTSLAASDCEINGTYHCYLPTELSTCCPMHIHADFYVDNSRKHIDFNGIEYNAKLISLAADALIKHFEEHHSSYAIPIICANLMPSASKLKEELLLRLKSGERLASLIGKLLRCDLSPSFEDIDALWGLIGHYAPVRSFGGRNAVHEQQLAIYFKKFSRPELKLVPLSARNSQSSEDNKPLCVPLPKPTIGDNQTELFCIIRETNVATINVMSVTVTAWQFPSTVAESLKKVNVWRNYDDSLTVLRAIIRSQGNHDTEDQRAGLLKAAATVDPVRNDVAGIRMSGSERHRSNAVLIPAKNSSGWARADECYFPSDILNKCLGDDSSYYRVDEKRAFDYLGEKYRLQLTFWGAWQVLPIHKNNKSSDKEWQLSHTATELKRLLSPMEMLDCLAKCFEFWQQGGFFTQNRSLLQAVAKDLYNTEWLEVVQGKDKVISSPAHTFNLSGNQTLSHVPFMSLEKIPSGHSLLLNWLHVRGIEHESSVNRLIWAANCITSQLEISKPRSVSREYRLVVSRLNSLRDTITINLNNFPRLIKDRSGTRIAGKQEVVYFLTAEEKRRVRGGSRLKLPLLDVPRDTAVEFIEKLPLINRFKPNPVIEPALGSIPSKPGQIEFIANKVLPKLFAYADVAEEINRDPDEDKIKERWSAIDIRVAVDGCEAIVSIQDPEGNQISSSSLEDDRAVWVPSSSSSKAATLILHPKFDWSRHHDLKALSKWMAQEVFRMPELQQGFVMTLLDETEIEPNKVEDNRRNIASWLSQDDEATLVACMENILDKKLEKGAWRLLSTYQGASLCYSLLRESVPKNLVSAIEHLDPRLSNADVLKRWLVENQLKLEVVAKAENISFERLTEDEQMDGFDFNPEFFTLGKLGIDSSDFKNITETLSPALRELRRDRFEIGLPAKQEVPALTTFAMPTQPSGSGGGGGRLIQVRSQSQYAAISEAKAEIGNNAESQIAIQFSQVASRLNCDQKSLFFGLVVNEYQRLLKEHRPEIQVAQLIDNLLSSSAPSSAMEWYKFLHVGKLFDGCGYDVLGVESENHQLLLVEVKHSSQTPPAIFLSENERQCIVRYTGNDFTGKYPTHKWRLYLTGEASETKDRTEDVKQVVIDQNEVYGQISSGMKATEWCLRFDSDI